MFFNLYMVCFSLLTHTHHFCLFYKYVLENLRKISQSRRGGLERVRLVTVNITSFFAVPRRIFSAPVIRTVQYQHTQFTKHRSTPRTPCSFVFGILPDISILTEANETRSHLDCSSFTKCIMRVIQFWINPVTGEWWWDTCTRR